MTGLAGSGHGSAVARSSQATSHDFAASDALARKSRCFGWQRVFYGSAEDDPPGRKYRQPDPRARGVRDECQRTHPRTAVEDVRSGWLAKARRPVVGRDHVHDHRGLARGLPVVPVTASTQQLARAGDPLVDHGRRANTRRHNGEGGSQGPQGRARRTRIIRAQGAPAGSPGARSPTGTGGLSRPASAPTRRARRRRPAASGRPGSARAAHLGRPGPRRRARRRVPRWTARRPAGCGRCR